VKLATVLLSAVVFAVGLGTGGMLEPRRVVGFLDFFGRWDPTLAFVMAGALGVNAIAYRLSSARKGPVLADRFYVPGHTRITGSLVLGSALFGVGWALTGFCPGPALTSIGAGSLPCVVLVGAMAVGALAAGQVQARLAPPSASSEGEPAPVR
jgi:uncharacterized protein